MPPDLTITLACLYWVSWCPFSTDMSKCYVHCLFVFYLIFLLSYFRIFPGLVWLCTIHLHTNGHYYLFSWIKTWWDSLSVWPSNLNGTKSHHPLRSWALWISARDVPIESYIWIWGSQTTCIIYIGLVHDGQEASPLGYIGMADYIHFTLTSSY